MLPTPQGSGRAVCALVPTPFPNFFEQFSGRDPDEFDQARGQEELSRIYRNSGHARGEESRNNSRGPDPERDQVADSTAQFHTERDAKREPRKQNHQGEHRESLPPKVVIVTMAPMKVADITAFYNVARELARSLSPREDCATVLALSGELGTGKTTFVQEVARHFGVSESVTSPTFVIEKVYELSGQKFGKLIHIDAYRLKTAPELEVLGWHDIASDPHNLILLEWPERVPELVPRSAVCLHFDIDGEGRIITIDGGEEGEKNS
jgi:tRNA threonylcarbamoyladenosine biosynthesis protein TsaE